MKIEKIKHTVNPDGTFKDKDGSVETSGKISMSAEKGGCGVPGCSCSPGHWIMTCSPRKGSTVECIKVIFDSKNEMDDFFKFRQLLGKTK